MTDDSGSPFPYDANQVAEKVLIALHGLRFGSVEVVVHDGRVIQIERKERQRLNLACPGEDAKFPRAADS